MIEIYGLGFELVGVFKIDPADGFPLRVIPSTRPSGYGVILTLGGLLIFVVLAAVPAVFLRFFLTRTQYGWTF